MNSFAIGINNTPADCENFVQAIKHDLNISARRAAFSLGRARPQGGYIGWDSRGPTGCSEDWATRHFVKSLNVGGVDPLQHLRPLPGNSWSDSDILVNVRGVVVVELIRSPDVLLGIDALDLISTPRSGGAGG